jgi:glucose-6-phosphate 1-dehydrogenase
VGVAAAALMGFTQGDLTWRKLMPALFPAYRHGKLPEGGRILAVARDERSDDGYRAFIKERFGDVEPSKQPSENEFQRFAQMLFYRRMDLSQPAHYAGLKTWLDEPKAEEEPKEEPKKEEGETSAAVLFDSSRCRRSLAGPSHRSSLALRS